MVILSGYMLRGVGGGRYIFLIPNINNFQKIIDIFVKLW